jgi:hypothetical protein
LDDHDVNERAPRYTVRRVFLPTSATESFTVIGPDLRPVELIEGGTAEHDLGASVADSRDEAMVTA